MFVTKMRESERAAQGHTRVDASARLRAARRGTREFRHTQGRHSLAAVFLHVSSFSTSFALLPPSLRRPLHPPTRRVVSHALYLAGS